MDLLLFVVLYLAVALLVAMFAYVKGVRSRPTPSILSVEDSALIALAAVLVGLLWILFTPVLTVRAIWLTGRWIEHRGTRLLLRFPKFAKRSV